MTSIVLNFQKAASVQGDHFHNECLHALNYAGFEIADQYVVLTDVGIELDAIVNNAHGIAIPLEFKGSLQGNRPGLRRTDTLKKAIANGYLLTRSNVSGMMTPLVVLTSHLPEAGHGKAMLDAVERDTIMAFIDSRDGRKLRKLCDMPEEKLRALVDGRIDL